MQLVLLTLLAAAAAGRGVCADSARVVFGYLPTWQLDQVAGADLARYTHVSLAFAVPDSAGNLSMDNLDGALASFTPQAGQRVLMSLGGWSGSKHLSAILGDARKRRTLAEQMVAWTRAHGLDGWDIDFEYPGRAGAACHRFDAENDTANLLALVTDLRTRLAAEFPDAPKLITLATRHTPFDGPGGVPLADVSAFAGPVDLFNLMLYDFTGGWAQAAGANAALDNAAPSFRSAVQAWVDAGIPAGQIAAGLPFYGRAVTVKETRDLSDPVGLPIERTVPQGSSEDAEEPDASCGGPAVFSGVWAYRSLRSEGVLPSADEPAAAAEPWVRGVDNGTATPWLLNRETRAFVSYDDPASIAAKARLADDMRLAGVMVWPLTGDYNGELAEAIFQE
ncbi:hypothetical protein LPJ53_003658 [Coemansia erecta]|uniref:GH18 domain-containing protein n=1 Tax=Coemansia erecta TaxID=147472 RepID=A0A9W7Y080_9FUNG|nr:hypothetical protein LPJ53_003658 [Coemansia erecta]